MKIAPLFDSQSELTDGSGSKCAIVLTTRVRLARNLAGQPFPGWAKESQRSAMMAEGMEAVSRLSQMKKGLSLTLEELTDLEKQILVERHLISRELSTAKRGAGGGHQPRSDHLGHDQRGGLPSHPGPARRLSAQKGLEHDQRPQGH